VIYAEGSRWKLYSGDALAVLPGIETVQAVITDPPYSSGGAFRGDRMGSARVKYATNGSESADRRPNFSGDNRDQRAYLAWCSVWLGMCLDVSEQGSPLVCFTDWRQLPITTDAIQCGGWVWRGIVPWVKLNSRPQMGRFSAQCEYAIWGTNGAARDSKEVGCLPGFYEAQPRPMAQREHLTEKPEEVMRGLSLICPTGGVILDPFCGSGSTGVGALREGRGFIGIERELAYLEIAARKLEQAENDGVQADLFVRDPTAGLKPGQVGLFSGGGR